MHHQKTKLSLLVLLAVAVIAAGCGGAASKSDGAASTRTVVMTKPHFVSLSNIICEKTDARQAAHYKAYLKTHEKDESRAGSEALVLRIGLPAIRVEVKELGALTPPEGDESQIAAILSSARTAIGESQKDPGLILGAKTNPFNKAEHLAAKFGLTDCGLQ